MHLTIDRPAQIHQLGELSDPPFGERVRDLVQARVEAQVLSERQPPEETSLVAVDQADQAPHLMHVPRDIQPVNSNRAAVGYNETGKDLDERCLAGPIRPEQPENVTTRNLQIDVINNDPRGCASGEGTPA